MSLLLIHVSKDSFLSLLLIRCVVCLSIFNKFIPNCSSLSIFNLGLGLANQMPVGLLKLNTLVILIRSSHSCLFFKSWFSLRSTNCSRVSCSLLSIRWLLIACIWALLSWCLILSHLLYQIILEFNWFFKLL